jgi:Adenine-specific methyltransferase EcoRI
MKDRRKKSPRVPATRAKTPSALPIRSRKNANLGAARANKNDEFYTQWVDIEREMGAYLDYNPDVFRDKVILLPCDDPEWSNFTKYFALHFAEFGIRKLISTSYAPDSKPLDIAYQPTLFELEDPKFDKVKTRSRGKKFILERKDLTGDGVINIDDLRWEYLEGDGDFRSEEIKKIRDEADIVVTNPPFSLWRECLAFLIEGGVKFSIIGNMNALGYKEVFPLIRGNEMWLGQSISSGDREFRVPDSYPLAAAGWRVDDLGQKFIRVKGVRWFTNIDHGRRHEQLQLMTQNDNRTFSKHEGVRGIGYKKYANFDAIEVPYTDAIPSDYDGAMGVPISFLDKYNPDQFEILGSSGELGKPMSEVAVKGSYVQGGPSFYIENTDGTYTRLYKRIVIRHRRKVKNK